MSANNLTERTRAGNGGRTRRASRLRNGRETSYPRRPSSDSLRRPYADSRDFEDHNDPAWCAVVEAVRARCGCCVLVRCPYCDEVHKHSAGDGHRVAHCTKPTSDNHRGYVVREIDASPAECGISVG